MPQTPAKIHEMKTGASLQQLLQEQQLLTPTEN
jgi:hypothetical protein